MAGALIGAAEAEERFGVRARHEVMENGELRFRLIGNDGNAYIRTTTTIGGWQRSHSHQRTYETYIVEAGWIAFATLAQASGDMVVEVHDSGSVFTTPLNVPHNVYLPAGATIHTVKHGSSDAAPDWQASDELDRLTRHLSEEKIRVLALPPVGQSGLRDHEAPSTTP